MIKGDEALSQGGPAEADRSSQPRKAGSSFAQPLKNSTRYLPQGSNLRNTRSLVSQGFT